MSQKTEFTFPANNIAMTSAGAYHANDYVGVDHIPFTIASAAAVNAGTGTILGATLVDYAAQSISAELWVFDTLPGPGNIPHDNAAWTLADAEIARCVGVITFTTYYASALNSISNGTVPSGGLGFKCLTGSTSLYGAIVTRGAPTYASLDLWVKLFILQDLPNY